MKELSIGDSWGEGRSAVRIIDKDRLCYKVLVESNSSIRTISKELVQEFVDYMGKHPDEEYNALDMRNALTGTTDTDKFEYGYASTLFQIAQAVIAIGSESEDVRDGACEVIKDSYSVDELVKLLRDIYLVSVKKGNKSSACLTFGFIYGKALKNVSCLKLVQLLNERYLSDSDKISENYHIEMSKGVKLRSIIDDNNLYSFIRKQLSDTHHPVADMGNAPLQQIYFGAPGTGKSHGVKLETQEWEKIGRVVRTTFHPDSDYSTFVGAYKPTTERVTKYNMNNEPVIVDGKVVTEKVISYEFIPQAFLQAYVNAWTNRTEPEYLIIEEINRGNCAQIFGDLFQLLDRGDDGYSEYAIKTDKDMQQYLSNELENVDIDDYPNVKNGSEMVLPCNLFIRATMNTSDQSLFPIDSAFKRRWDWRYIPIVNAGKNYKIEADGVFFDWWDFVSKINDEIAKATSSEDKKLGYFFCKAKDGVISADTFVGKVVFYLYNDVFKDADDGLEAFNNEDGRRVSFDSFYTINDDGLCVVNDKAVRNMLEKMGVVIVNSNNDDDEDIYGGDTGKHRFVINDNDEAIYKVSHVAWKCIEEYVRMHPDQTADQVYSVWSKFNRYNLFKKTILLEEHLFSLNEKNSRLVNEIKCAGGTRVWGYRNGWTHNPAKNNDSLTPFIEAVNESDLGITIVEEEV